MTKIPRLLVAVLAAVLLCVLTGCVSSAITAAQAEGRLPAADIEEAQVDISTAYGTSYTLNVKDVKVAPDGKRKTYGQYESRFTSPLGSTKVTAKGVKVKLTAEK